MLLSSQSQYIAPLFRAMITVRIPEMSRGKAGDTAEQVQAMCEKVSCSS